MRFGESNHSSYPILTKFVCCCSRLTQFQPTFPNLASTAPQKRESNPLQVIATNRQEATGPTMINPFWKRFCIPVNFNFVGIVGTTANFVRFSAFSRNGSG